MLSHFIEWCLNNMHFKKLAERKIVSNLVRISDLSTFFIHPAETMKSLGLGNVSVCSRVFGNRIIMIFSYARKFRA